MSKTSPVYWPKNKALPADLEVSWHYLSLPQGEVLAAVAQDRLCWLGFADLGKKKAMQSLQKDWGSAKLVEQLHPLMHRLDSAPLLLRGTDFQAEVWKVLLGIKQGKLMSYSEIAEKIGRPKAARAVGNAVGANPVAWRVPCHRVGHKDGGMSGFMWGEACKRRLLTLEGYAL